MEAWELEVRQWLHARRGMTPELANSAVQFFECAFEHTQQPQQAWFGVRPSGIVLLASGIYLASIRKSDPDRGVWLLLDGEVPPIEGVKYSVVKSTKQSTSPLTWGHLDSYHAVASLLDSTSLWQAFARASARISDFSIGRGREEVRQREKKRRLGDIWSRKSLSLYLDEEDQGGEIFREGLKKTIVVNAYERDRRARDACVRYYGTNCSVCGISFGKMYGLIAEGFIHVHHLKPLSAIGGEYVVDPIKDLRPVCPNCHAVIHLRQPSLSIEEVKSLLNSPTSK
jgi:hypothetical protein